MNITFLKKLVEQQRHKLIDVATEMDELETLISTLETYIECEENERTDTQAICFESNFTEEDDEDD